MPTMEVKETDWDFFCKRFADDHQGALVSLDTVSHSGARDAKGSDLALRKFEFTKTEGCNDLILITLGEHSEVQHQIVEPIHLFLREETGGRKMLQIDAETGSVELRFSSGRIGALLVDLESRK
jgi:hypothetical protein